MTRKPLLERERFRLLKAALMLNRFLRDNVGDTADWPIHLHVDNTPDAEKLAEILTEFSLACKDYADGAWDKITKFLKE